MCLCASVITCLSSVFTSASVAEATAKIMSNVWNFQYSCSFVNYLSENVDNYIYGTYPMVAISWRLSKLDKKRAQGWLKAQFQLGWENSCSPQTPASGNLSPDFWFPPILSLFWSANSCLQSLPSSYHSLYGVGYVLPDRRRNEYASKTLGQCRTMRVRPHILWSNSPGFAPTTVWPWTNYLTTLKPCSRSQSSYTDVYILIQININ